MYKALHHSGLADNYLVQEFTRWSDAVATFHIYPLWLCPLRLARNTPRSADVLQSEFGRLPPEGPGLMNLGIWGPGSTDRREFIRQNSALERKVSELGGKKLLYAHVYYTEDEFWSNYDKKSYDAVRGKYGASWMPSVYDKVKVDLESEDRELRSWIPWLMFMLWISGP